MGEVVKADNRMERHRMRLAWRRSSLCLVIVGIGGQLPFAEGQQPESWTVHAINDQVDFEACGVADFNGDGKLDVFSGDSWYEAPDWKRHKVRSLPPCPNPHYQEDFCDAPMDVNGDGHIDIVTCSYFGKRFGWVENPGTDPTQPWKEHQIDLPGNMETAVLLDINGDGQADFLPNTGNVVVWYELTGRGADPTWTKHELGTEGAGHGVGAGDINRDGKLDLITPSGWWEAPGSAEQKWTFHKEFDLGAAGILIHGRDVDGDQKTDIVWGMGHGFGLYWMRQQEDAQGNRTWQKEEIDGTYSQVHTLHYADLDGDGVEELITGKRVYAHEVEPGDVQAPVVYAYQFLAQGAKWKRTTLYRGQPAANAPANPQERWALKDFPKGSVGTGLQVAAVDLDGDGDTDLVCPGKSGLYYLENPKHP